MLPEVVVVIIFVVGAAVCFDVGFSVGLGVVRGVGLAVGFDVVRLTTRPVFPVLMVLAGAEVGTAVLRLVGLLPEALIRTGFATLSDTISCRGCASSSTDDSTLEGVPRRSDADAKDVMARSSTIVFIVDCILAEFEVLWYLCFFAF